MQEMQIQVQVLSLGNDQLNPPPRKQYILQLHEGSFYCDTDNEATGETEANMTQEEVCLQNFYSFNFTTD